MTVYVINYDLNEPGQDYSDLYDEIKSLGDWAHILESCWLVDTTKSASTIRDDLQDSVDSNDDIFVMKKGSSWATTFTSESTDWLHNH